MWFAVLKQRWKTPSAVSNDKANKNPASYKQKIGINARYYPVPC